MEAIDLCTVGLRLIAKDAAETAAVLAIVVMQASRPDYPLFPRPYFIDMEHSLLTNCSLLSSLSLSL